MKFATKLTAFLLVIFIVFGVLISYFVYISNLKTLEEEITDRLEEQAFHVMDKIDRNLYERYADIQVIATDPMISSRDSTPKQITERLIEYRNTLKTYTSLSFMDLGRVRIADTAGFGIEKQNRITKYWEEVSQGKISAASDIYESKTTGIVNIHFASPVKDKNGEIFGFVVARMPISKLYEITRKITLSQAEEEFAIDLVDKDGLLLYSNTNKKGILKDNYADSEAIKRSMAGEKIGSLTNFDPINKEEDILVFVHEQGYLDFKGNDWTLLVHVPTRIAFASAAQLRNRTLLIMLPIIAFAILVVSFFSKTITNPITKLSQIAVEIGKGNLDARVNITTKDELKDLAVEINNMASNLKAYQIKLLKVEKTRSNELEAEVGKKTKELKKNIDDLQKARTATLNMMEDLRQANEDLKGLDTAKAEFLNMVSHELKTPLTPISANLELLRAGDFGKLTKKQISRLNVVSRNTERLRDIIGNLLEIARIEAGKITLNIEKLQINAIAKEVAQDIELAAKDKGLRVSVKLGKLSTVKADRDRIKECISNFMNNALKFTMKGRINLQTEKKKDHIKVSVTDTGMGVEKDNMPNLFHKFYQTSKTEVGKAKGVGLGLYSVKKLIELHGGTVGVESTFGKGSTFWFTLPTKGGKK